MSRISKVFDHIDAHHDEFLGRLFEYLRQPSISAHGVGIRETANDLVQLFGRIGLECELHETAGWPILVGRRSDHPGAPTALFYGHYDVQPPDPLEEWVSAPFEPTIRNGRIYARGVGDNKGQHFANLLAIESTLACHNSLPCNVIVVLEGEEEVGSPHIAGFIRDHAQQLAVDLAITSDGPVHDSGRPCILFGVRGVASFELRSHGARTDLHSGNWGGVAPNPLWTLVHLLSTMKNKSGEITIDGFYDAIQPATLVERQALDALPYDVDRIKAELGVQVLDAPRSRAIADRLGLWPTLTINGLHGGYGGPGSKTVIPCKATAKCDIRLVSDQSRDDVLSCVEAHVRKHAPEVDFIPMGGMEPSKTPLDSLYAEPLRRAILEAQGEEPLLVPALGGTLPDYVFTQILKIPSFVIPYANADEANHAPNENLELKRFFAGIKTGAAILDQLGQFDADSKVQAT